MIRLFGIILLSLALAACGDVANAPNYEPNNVTVEGYQVFIPPEISELHLNSSISIIDKTEIDQMLLEWVDTRVQQWIAFRTTEYDEQYLFDIAQKQLYVLFDDHLVPCPPNGYSGGCYFPQNKTILSAIYTLPDATLGDIGIRSVCHELDHALGLSHDEMPLYYY